MMIHKKNFVKELKKAIENETYDEFMETTGKDEWEIIEDLLSLIDRQKKSGAKVVISEEKLIGALCKSARRI